MLAKARSKDDAVPMLRDRAEDGAAGGILLARAGLAVKLCRLSPKPCKVSKGLDPEERQVVSVLVSSVPSMLACTSGQPAGLRHCRQPSGPELCPMSGRMQA